MEGAIKIARNLLDQCEGGNMPESVLKANMRLVSAFLSNAELEGQDASQEHQRLFFVELYLYDGST